MSTKPAILQLKRSNGQMAWVNYEMIMGLEQKVGTRVNEIVVYLKNGTEIALEDSETNLSKILGVFRTA